MITNVSWTDVYSHIQAKNNKKALQKVQSIDAAYLIPDSYHKKESYLVSKKCGAKQGKSRDKDLVIINSIDIFV